jgi:hypothetical protein
MKLHEIMIVLGFSLLLAYGLVYGLEHDNKYDGDKVSCTDCLNPNDCNVVKHCETARG